MKTVSIAVLALISSAVAVQADGFTTPVQSSPRAVGCYIKGYGVGEFVTQRADIGPVVIDSLGQKGLGVGGQVGCDVKEGMFVAGVFADYTWNRANASVTIAGVPVMSVPYGSEWSVGGRLGLSFGPAMVYGLAAYTVAQDRNVAMMGVPLSIAGPKGVAIGAGLEYAVTKHIIASLEYRHVGFDADASMIVPSKFTVTEDQVRLGMGFKF